MALSLLAVHQASEDLLNCVCQGLARIPTEVPGLAGCPCRSCVVPGTPAADGCGTNTCAPLPDGQFPGQLTVHVIRIYATERQDFPRESAARDASTVRDGKNCMPPPTTAVELAVTLYRCIPGLTKEGCPPSCEDLSASAMQLHVDMLNIQQSVLCCYSGTDTTRRHGRRYVLGPSRTVGPQGDCVGIEQRVTVALDDCLPCPVPAP